MKVIVDTEDIKWSDQDVVTDYLPFRKALLLGIKAERVIQCKDCKHISTEGKTTRYYFCTLSGCPIDETDFCSRGERK